METQILTKEILDVDDITLEKVVISEWGKYCFVKVMTANERAKFIARVGAATGDVPVDLMEEVVVLTCTNAKGELIFTNKDKAKLSTKSGMALEKIFKAASKLNGLNKEGVEQIKGESPPTSSLGSPSG